MRPSPTDQRSIDLGFEGLVILDRAGQQVTLASFARPTNAAILSRIKSGDGVLTDVRGLDDSSGRVVAYANSTAPGWTTVIDRPASRVFAPARKGLFLELVVIGAAAFAVLCIIGWALLRSRREQEAERLQIRHWDELAQSLGDASATGEVSAALGAALSTAFPHALVIVAVREDERSDLTVSTFAPQGADRLASDDPSVVAIAALAYEATDHIALTGADLAPVLGQAITELQPPTRLLYGLPLRTQAGRPTGSMTLLLPEEQPVGGAEESLLVAHAEHASRALDRARRHEREHDVAIALQRSLLPEALPAIEGLDFAGRYNAGGVGLAVGGDWYDAVRRPDGILHLTVGDVAGRGIPAAVLMGQLRNAFRALAYDHTSPGEIARRLTRLVPLDGMATAVFLTIDPYTGEVAYASTGHPPSLLLDVEADAVTRLDQANAPPLGWAAADEIQEARFNLPTNGAMLAYTDGLVERRGVEHRRRHRPGGGAAPGRVGAVGCRGRRPAARLPRDPALCHGRHRAAPRPSHRRAVADGDRDPRRIQPSCTTFELDSGRGSRGAGSARSNRPMRCWPCRKRATTRSSTDTPDGAGRSSCGSSTGRIC